MDLSVVVPTLNARDRLAGCLDALAERAPGAEVVVVDGPSTDGTAGMVRDRGDVDVLVDISERNVNVARNAGFEAAGGEAVAFLEDPLRVEEGWADAARAALADADVATGPRHEQLRGGVTTDTLETETVAGRPVTYFDGGNAAFRRRALSAVDGFDEYLQTGGARDAAHRLAAARHEVAWAPGMAAECEMGTDGGTRLRTDVPRPNADESELDTDWGWKYRALAYRLAKNYGYRPAVAYGVGRHAVRDGAAEALAVVRGEATPTTWWSQGRAVVGNGGRGLVDGWRARRADPSPARNPNGVSDRDDRAVDVYDWREAGADAD